jgi:hypothetical protein
VPATVRPGHNMPIFAGHSVSVVHYSSRYHVTEATLHQCSLFTPEESSRRLWLHHLTPRPTPYIADLEKGEAQLAGCGRRSTASWQPGKTRADDVRHGLPRLPFWVGSTALEV